jgi:arsenate reductase (glutaredoxin)
MDEMTPITIFHNPACGTSRNVLALIRNSGVEPRIVEYLQQSPGRDDLVQMLAAMQMPVRALPPTGPTSSS